MEVTRHEPGTFCWVEYASTDLQAAKEFYGKLFGWSLDESPTPNGPYVMARIDGKDVAALMGLSDQEREQGVPPHWNSYVTVDSVDAAATKVGELGGRVLAEPFDLKEAGRMAVLADPTGAPLSLWQPAAAIGAERVNEPNTLCWNELYTNDLDAAERFYTALFGWRSARGTSSESSPLVELYNGERPTATLMAILPEWGPMPSAWGVYFAVADCEATLERAKSLGGDVVLPPRDIPPGRFAVLRDPQGGSCSIIRLKN